jgi:class 3 adenylate cyclase
MITNTQLPEKFRQIIDKQIEIYKNGRSITQENKLPETSHIPINNPNHWLKIPDVICVFADMIGSTKLSASKHDKSTAGAYQLFSNTIVRLFHELNASYIDIKGDGVFALFNSDQPNTALASAVTIKTFVNEEFINRIKSNTELDIGLHIAIDQKTLLVRKIGFKRYGDRTDRQNEVWAGRTVNMASKLASITKQNEMLVSDRFFKNLKDDLVLKSCGCPNNEVVDLWKEYDLSDNELFDFDKAYLLESNWCKEHGADFCTRIIELDK